MIKYNSPRSFKFSSRYQNNRVIYNSDYDKSYFELSNNNKIDTETYPCKYHLVEQRERNRLDLIAYKYYGDGKYFWIIALANNLIDPFIIQPNTLLKIPATESLYLPGSPWSRSSRR